MSIISEVKCARCDRSYSGVRSRCPYCGARRIGGGKYSEEGDNSKGKMIIGVLILAVLVVAAGVLLFTTQKPEPPAETISDSETPPTQDLPGEEGNVSVTGAKPPVSPSPSPIETPPEETTTTPPPQVQSVIITYGGVENGDFTAPVGDKVPLKAKVEPAGIEFDEEIVWKSSDTSVFEVVKDNPEGTSAQVIMIGSGSQKSATLTVSIGGVEATCIVRLP